MRLALVVVTVCGFAGAACAETLCQVISREDPAFHCGTSAMTVGKDGKVYLTTATNDAGYVMRLAADGATDRGPPPWRTDS